MVNALFDDVWSYACALAKEQPKEAPEAAFFMADMAAFQQFKLAVNMCIDCVSL